MHDIGDGQGAVKMLAAMQHPSSSAVPGVIECNLPINTGPAHWVLNADDAVEAGFILEPDAKELTHAASSSDIGQPSSGA